MGEVGRGVVLRWRCRVCGWVYDEANGFPDQQILPGTRFEDLGPDWACPICGAPKEEFERVDS